MVRFLHSTQPDGGPITVWCEPADEGFRLVRRDPTGRVSTECFQDHAALFEGTVRLQSALTRAGWRPDRQGAARAHAARARQFHR